MTAVEPFATPTTCLIHFEANGIPERKRALGALRRLPRPWDPFTCADPDLRLELWVWLDDVVTCINHEYVWDTAAYIPSCWQEHPTLSTTSRSWQTSAGEQDGPPPAMPSTTGTGTDCPRSSAE